ncbi:MAG: hypothetical protein ACREM3_06850 [Candidatus Rokuibacteriota bacterium]
MEKPLTFSAVTLAAVCVFLTAQAAHAGIPPNGTPVSAPGTLALLSAAAGVFAIGTWWRSRRK